MTPPENGKNWDKWSDHLDKRLDDHAGWLEKLDRRQWQMMVMLTGAMIMLIGTLIGVVFSLVKG